MASKLNSEFNYRYQVIGETVWEKIKTLKGFLEGRENTEKLQQISKIKYEAKLLELEHSKQISALPHIVKMLEAEILEIEIYKKTENEAFELNKQEIEMLKKLISEYYELAEPTRLKHQDGSLFSDEEMFEVNAANEFTTMIVREIQAEIIATGRPSAAKIKNAMSNPITWSCIKQLGLIPKEVYLIEPSISPELVQFKLIDDNGINLLENKDANPTDK